MSGSDTPGAGPAEPPADAPSQAGSTSIPDETAIDERTLLGLYAGENAAPFLHFYDHAVASGSRYDIWSWCWPALLAPFAWLMYRRLWVHAAAWFLVPVSLIYLLGDAPAAHTIWIALAVLAKPAYIDDARRRIKAIIAENDDPNAIRRKVLEAGSVSVPGFVLGLAVSLVGFGAATLTIISMLST